MKLGKFNGKEKKLLISPCYANEISPEKLFIQLIENFSLWSINHVGHCAAA